MKTQIGFIVSCSETGGTPWVPVGRDATFRISSKGHDLGTTTKKNEILNEAHGIIFGKQCVADPKKDRVEIFPTEAEAVLIKKDLEETYPFEFKVFPVFIEA